MNYVGSSVEFLLQAQTYRISIVNTSSVAFSFFSFLVALDLQGIEKNELTYRDYSRRADDFLKQYTGVHACMLVCIHIT